MGRTRKGESTVKGENKTTKRPDSNELQEVFKAAAKRYGEGAVHAASRTVQPNRISTGVFILDLALLGGIPEKRVTTIVGERHSGKSMLASMIAGNAQKKYPDRSVVLLDIEDTAEPVWMSKLGVDTDKLYIASCETGEMAVDMGVAVAQAKETSLVIVDSIAALTPIREVKSSAEDESIVALQARLVNTFLRRMTSAIMSERKRGHDVTLILLNQFRAKIGGFAGFGEAKTMPGGRLLEAVASLQLTMKNKENKGKNKLGIDAVLENEHAYTITKNKCNAGPRTGEFVVVREDDEEKNIYAGHVDDFRTVLLYAKKFGFYEGTGAASKTLDIPDYTRSYRVDEDALADFRADRDLYWALRTHIIREQARSQGMPEEFIKRIG